MKAANTTEDGRPTTAEKAPLLVFHSPEAGARYVASEVAELIRSRTATGRNAVLGLPTGSTPLPLYRELVRLHREDGLSFANVVTFNLDEYYPMPPGDPRSYHRYMRQNLFDHVDIPHDNTHLPDGTVPAEDVMEYCRAYENAIRHAGGIDFMVLGIGRNGHVAFNEPGSAPDSRTRLVDLDVVTRTDAAAALDGSQSAPTQAMTMGLATILGARRVALLAWGAGKKAIVERAFEGPVDHGVPASFLQSHPGFTIVLDFAAAGQSPSYTPRQN